ncbi:mitochondrial ribosomal protein L27-domain-containing protein [Tribonema minus]|uniref:Mitochondrial ribosomal protein L27-domain-containing protein n=1 Tax=Tribonema minus TaxID=303371 RepID=A0A835ZJH5_9STRA|nr:mitochondrial ribosomal protein L27-domain-containing protein [Tribonema minus]
MPVLGDIARGALRMSKYLSKAATKRAPLHRKHGNKNFYKGTGARSEGKLNSKAKFILDKDKLLELVAPDLTNFQLKPYVAKSIYPRDILQKPNAIFGTENMGHPGPKPALRE